jgi:hypothetical protein
MKRDRSKFSAAVLVILLDRDRICVIRRDATGFLDGHFTIPGGVLEEGETLGDAARRQSSFVRGAWCLVQAWTGPRTTDEGPRTRATSVHKAHS